MSTGGVYRTSDGGKSWQPRNVGVRAEFMPDKYPEFGQCVHKVVRHPARPDTLFLQNHWGLYRTDDGGDSWRDIANGIPSDFGFSMAIHPHDPDTVYVVPLESDMYRCTPEGKMRVFRTLDGGKSWKPLTNGLPQKNAHETVLRDALGVDNMNPAGVYVGTRSGKVYASPDGGMSWALVADGLPPVLVVHAAVIGDPAKLSVPGRKRATAAARPVVKRRCARQPAGRDSASAQNLRSSRRASQLQRLWVPAPRASASSERPRPARARAAGPAARAPAPGPHAIFPRLPHGAASPVAPRERGASRASPNASRSRW